MFSLRSQALTSLQDAAGAVQYMETAGLCSSEPPQSHAVKKIRLNTVQGCDRNTALEETTWGLVHFSCCHISRPTV